MRTQAAQDPGRAADGSGAARVGAGIKLEALRYHWGEAFETGRDDERGHRARRRHGPGGDITASSPDERLTAIAAGYANRPVSRELATSAAWP
jgi:hypothetical protein